MSLRVLVFGGRDFNNVELLMGWLNTIHDTEVIAVLIEGGQTGADTLARKFAKDKGILCETYKPDWNKYGKAAGPIRNKQCLPRVSLICSSPSLVVLAPLTW